MRGLSTAAPLVRLLDMKEEEERERETLTYGSHVTVDGKGMIVFSICCRASLLFPLVLFSQSPILVFEGKRIVNLMKML